LRGRRFTAGHRGDFVAEDIELSIGGRGAERSAVKKVSLKTDSIGQVLNLALPYTRLLG